jgi:hypothetical protein
MSIIQDDLVLPLQRVYAHPNADKRVIDRYYDLIERFYYLVFIQKVNPYNGSRYLLNPVIIMNELSPSPNIDPERSTNYRFIIKYDVVLESVPSEADFHSHAESAQLRTFPAQIRFFLEVKYPWRRCRLNVDNLLVNVSFESRRRDFEFPWLKMQYWGKDHLLRIFEIWISIRITAHKDRDSLTKEFDHKLDAYLEYVNEEVEFTQKKFVSLAPNLIPEKHYFSTNSRQPSFMSQVLGNEMLLQMIKQQGSDNYEDIMRKLCR